MTEQTEHKDVGGRPSKYRHKYSEVARCLALLGLTDEQIAENLGIATSTLYEWKKKFRRFAEALAGGKVIADAQVAEGLFKRATGFKYDEVTYERIELAEPFAPTEDEPIKKDPYKKKVISRYMPPDPGAAMSWLKNRQKDLWRDKQDLGIEFENMTDEQLDRFLERATQMALKQPGHE